MVLGGQKRLRFFTIALRNKLEALFFTESVKPEASEAGFVVEPQKNISRIG